MVKPATVFFKEKEQDTKQKVEARLCGSVQSLPSALRVQESHLLQRVWISDMQGMSLGKAPTALETFTSLQHRAEPCPAEKSVIRKQLCTNKPATSWSHLTVAD